jgi:AcrR family transcriptional regulator
MTAKPHVRKSASQPRRTAEERLTEALETLAHRHEGSTRKVTVTELCRLANVSRNSLYRYHTTSLRTLRKLQCRRPSVMESKAIKSDERRRVENVALHEYISKLAALVDHYYARYRETSALLRRRDGELAELRRRVQLTPTVVKS